MNLTEEQKKAIEEGRIVPIEIKINLLQSILNPTISGGEDSGKDDNTDRTRLT